MANWVGVVLDKNLSVHERGARFFQKSRRPSIFALMVMVLATGAGVVSAQSLRDRDGDGVPDLLDNCINVANPDQSDTDMDGFGNACDADVNNDGVVNYDDLVMILSNWGKVGPGDTNGDGKVDAEDWVFVEKMQGTKPGPTGIKPFKPTADGRRVPVADQVRLMSLDAPLPDGRNTWVVADFRRFMKSMGVLAVPSVISVRHGENFKKMQQLNMTPFDLWRPNGAGESAGELVYLNDSGIFGDEVAGDYVYSGFAKLDHGLRSAEIGALLNRVRSSGKSVVKKFDDKVVVGSEFFDINNPFLPLGGGKVIKFRLPSGYFERGVAPIKMLQDIPSSVNPDRTLMVRDLGVVQDPVRTFSPCSNAGKLVPTGNPDGAWSFKSLMTAMANTAETGISAKEFTHDWLKQWLIQSPGAVGSDGQLVLPPIPERSQKMKDIIRSLQPQWNPNDFRTLDMNKLPFRLLAIVNRIDLAKPGVGGYINPNASLVWSSGEVRFVFGLVEKRGNVCGPARLNPLPSVYDARSDAGMTVILEYAVPKTTCGGLKWLAQRWVNLNDFVPGSSQYNSSLQSLTDAVTKVGANSDGVNKSAIAQVRTNEIVLGRADLLAGLLVPVWEMREFTLQKSPVHGRLLPATLKGTPNVDMNNTSVLYGFSANDLATHIRYGRDLDSPPWDIDPPDVDKDRRFKFSMGTCNGCHLGENGTNFTMIRSDASFSVPAALSGFLKGVENVPDLKYPGSIDGRNFHELEERGKILDIRASMSCFEIMGQGQLSRLPRSSLDRSGVH